MARTRGSRTAAHQAARGQQQMEPTRAQLHRQRATQVATQPIVYERHLEQFLVENTEIGAELIRRGWLRLFGRPEDADEALVREFYREVYPADFRQPNNIRFRRVRLNLSPQWINEFFNLPPVETNSDGIEDEVAAMDAGVLVSNLRMDGRQVMEATQRDFTYAAACWNYLNSWNITPMDTRTKPGLERLQIIYSLIFERALDFGKIMVRFMTYAAHIRRRDSLVYPHFLTQLLRAQGIQLAAAGLQPAAIIGIHSINLIRKSKDMVTYPPARSRARAASRARVDGIRQEEGEREAAEAAANAEDDDAAEGVDVGGADDDTEDDSFDSLDDPYFQLRRPDFHAGAGSSSPPVATTAAANEPPPQSTGAATATPSRPPPRASLLQQMLANQQQMLSNQQQMMANQQQLMGSHVTMQEDLAALRSEFRAFQDWQRNAGLQYQRRPRPRDPPAE